MSTKYQIPVEFTFKGTFYVEADDAEEAKRKCKKDFGMTMSGGITTTLDQDEADWNFDVHPDKKIGRVKKAQV
ncbi:hypothetical protein AGMMS49944_04010 [Spirochaetia bacterium]|nr:hypothetical protein AGMMS49944_04010 [Spirochaetia bacterium]